MTVRKYVLRYTPEAKNKIAHLPPPLKQTLRTSLEQLQLNPWLGKPLQRDLTGFRSLRVGSHRVIYQIDEDHRHIHVLTLGARKTIYEDLKKRH